MKKINKDIIENKIIKAKETLTEMFNISVKEADYCYVDTEEPFYIEISVNDIDYLVYTDDENHSVTIIKRKRTEKNDGNNIVYDYITDVTITEDEKYIYDRIIKQVRKLYEKLKKDIQSYNSNVLKEIADKYLPE